MKYIQNYRKYILKNLIKKTVERDHKLNFDEQDSDHQHIPDTL